MRTDLRFSAVGGTWSCGSDYLDVKLTRVDGPFNVTAYAFVCNVQVNTDGAGNSYGPPDKDALDSLSNAGPSPDPKKGWYGVAALTPAEAKQHGAMIDQKAPRDVNGRFPVVNQVDPYRGFYVSTTSRRADDGAPEWEQRRYIDASAVPYGVLSGGLHHEGFSLGDRGLSMRLDNNLQVTSSIADGGPVGNKVGEYSYKVFKDLGGVWMSRGRFANDFKVCHLLIRDTIKAKTKKHQKATPAREVDELLASLATATNASDLPLLLAFQMGAERHRSGLELMRRYQRSLKSKETRAKGQPGKGSNAPPMLLGAASSALRRAGYHPTWGDFNVPPTFWA